MVSVSGTRVFYILGAVLLGLFVLFVFIQKGLDWTENPSGNQKYQAALAATGNTLRNLPADGPDEALKIYGVHVVRSLPFEGPSIGFGIYLGNGQILTAAHVAGRWPEVSDLRVLIGGKDLAATVIKSGSPSEVDLALVAVDLDQLPAAIALRRTVVCKTMAAPGTRVRVVTPERAEPTRIISPIQLEPRWRKKYGTLVDHQEGSGSGVFSERRKCLLGIMSMRVPKLRFGVKGDRLTPEFGGYAGYFVPADQISRFIHS